MIGRGARIVAVALGVALSPACRPTTAAKPDTPRQGADEVISEVKAIELARAACAGNIEIPASVRPRVSMEAGRCVVVFPTSLAPGTRGADYHAKVTLDAKSGTVIEVLGGS